MGRYRLKKFGLGWWLTRAMGVLVSVFGAYAWLILLGGLR